MNHSVIGAKEQMRAGYLWMFCTNPCHRICVELLFWARDSIVNIPNRRQPPTFDIRPFPLKKSLFWFANYSLLMSRIVFDFCTYLTFNYTCFKKLLTRHWTRKHVKRRLTFNELHSLSVIVPASCCPQSLYQPPFALYTQSIVSTFKSDQ